MCSKGNILGRLSNRNKGKVNRCISMFGCQGYLLDNDCYASLAAVLYYCDVWQPGLTLLRLGAHCTPYIFLPCCAKTVHCSSTSSFTLNIGIKYNLNIKQKYERRCV